MNMGSAVSVHEEEVRQTTVIMASSAGWLVNCSISTIGTQSSARPIQAPVPSSSKRRKWKIAMAVKGSIVLLGSGRVGKIGADIVPPGEEQADEIVDQAQGQQHGADGNGDLDDPERRRILALTDILQAP